MSKKTELRWNAQNKAKVILNILAGFDSIQTAVKKYNINDFNIHEWAQEISPTLEKFKEIIRKPPAIVCWKDVNLKYEGCNTNLSKVMGLSSPEKILGLSASDICYKDAEKYQLDARIAMETRVPFNVTRTLYYQSSLQFITTSQVIPLLDHKETPYGVLYFGDIKNNFQIRGFQDFITFINKNNLPVILRDTKFLINYKNQSVFLSRREAACLLLLMKGIKIKQVSYELGISPRTIINYLENIKSKLHVNTTNELIALAFISDFLINLGIILST